MFCPSCGNKLDGGSKFCGSCGTRIDPAASSGDPTAHKAAKRKPAAIKSGLASVGPAELPPMDADALYAAGCVCSESESLDRHLEKAADYFEKAARLGHAEAQFDLGNAYAKGLGVSQDDEQAAMWFEKAANLGYAAAQSRIGTFYTEGIGVSQNYKKAVSWLQKAATQGRAVAQYNLATMYDKGRGVAQDSSQAFVWYHKAAEQGDEDAQFAVANMYYEGEGIEQDHAQAATWFLEAAKQNHAGAQYWLGSMLYDGEGVAQDYEEASVWFRRAAEQDHAKAQYMLGALHEDGVGLEQDYELALAWYRKAVEQGYEEAEVRIEAIEAGLSAESLGVPQITSDGRVHDGFVPPMPEKPQTPFEKPNSPENPTVSIDTLKALLEDASHKCEMDGDGDLYVKGDVEFPFWIRVIAEQELVRFFTYIPTKSKATHWELLTIVNDANKYVVLPGFYYDELNSGGAFFGHYFMSSSSGLDRAQFIGIARRFASAFSYAVNNHDPNDLLGH